MIMARQNKDKDKKILFLIGILPDKDLKSE